MKNYLGLSIISLSAMAICQAEEAKPKDFPWRIGLGYRLGFNVDASFRNTGLPGWTPPGQSGPLQSLNGRYYNDGGVGLDSTGNMAHPLDPDRPLTSYWGYQNAGQWQGGSILMHYSEAGSLGRGADDIDLFSHGFEITLGRELGQKGKLHYGVELGFAMSPVSARWVGQANPNVLGTDAYQLPSDVVLPLDNGFFGTQDREMGMPYLYTASTPMATTVDASLDANIYAIRLGPYLEYELSKRFSLTLGGGLSIMVVDGGMNFIESSAGQTRDYHAEQLDAFFGVYCSGQVVYKVNECWDLFTGVQLHYFGSADWEARAGDKMARLDMTGCSWYWTIGFGYHF